MVVGSESFWELYREYLLNASKVNLGGTSVSRESVSARAFSRKIENQQLLDNYCSCTFRAHPTLDLIDLISESDSDSDSKANPRPTSTSSYAHCNNTVHAWCLRSETYNLNRTTAPYSRITTTTSSSNFSNLSTGTNLRTFKDPCRTWCQVAFSRSAFSCTHIATQI